MSWTTPRTWVVDEIVTAALLNTHLRDNLNVGRGYSKTTRSSGNISMNSTSAANLDTGLDATLAAATSDRISYDFGFQCANEAPEAYIDVYTTAGSNYFSPLGLTGSGQGNASLKAQASVYSSSSTTAWRTLVSGDISGGNVVCRLRYKTSSAAVKTMNCDGTFLAIEYVVNNVGPAV